MAARTSKEVTDRQKSCRFVLSAFLRQGERIADQLLDLVRPHLEEGDVEPGFFPVISSLARRLQASLHQLVEVDETVYSANVRFGKLRDEREALFARLARLIARLRLTLINQFVAPRLDDLGLENETARSPIPLLRQADRIGQVFVGEGVAKLLGESIFEQPVGAASQAAELAPVAEALRRILEEVDDARRQLDEGVVAKEERMKDHDQVFLRTARSFEDFCRLAGEQKLAERVRPSKDRPGQTEEEPPEDDPPAEAAADSDSEGEGAEASSRSDEVTEPPLAAQQPSAAGDELSNS